jgi:chemotaxis protein MotB
MGSSARTGTLVLLGLFAALQLGSCVTKSHYNAMLQQQQTLENALRSEISAQQVKIEQLENGIRVRMTNDLLYRSGSVELHPAGRAALQKVAPQLANMAAQGNRIDVVGNTDDVPVGRELAERYPTNWELAGARAAVVVRYLQEQGVDPRQMDAVSQGQYHPVTPGNSPAVRAEDRRTELLIRPQ